MTRSIACIITPRLITHEINQASNIHVVWGDIDCTANRFGRKAINDEDFVTQCVSN